MDKNTMIVLIVLIVAIMVIVAIFAWLWLYNPYMGGYNHMEPGMHGY